MSEDGEARAERSAASPPRTRRVPWRALALSVWLAIVVVLGGLWLARSAILTALVAQDLERRGVHCEGLALEASATLDAITVGPASCAIGAGAIAAVAWDEPLRATAEGPDVASLEGGTLRVTRRPSGGDLRAASLGPVGDLLRAPERVGGVLHFAARLSERSSPRLEASRVEVRVEGSEDPELTLGPVRIPARAAGSPVEASIGEIALGPSEGPLGIRTSIRMAEVEVHAEPTRGSLEGLLDPSVRLPMLGTLSLGGLTGGRRVAITVEQLDSSNPLWNVQTR